VIDNLFLAVAFTDEERHALAAALTESTGPARIPGKRTSPENWHVTLSFIGECSDADSDRIAHSISDQLNAVHAKVWCTGLDAFPTSSKATVIYTAVDDPTNVLTYLAGICDEAAVDAGYGPEQRPYVPHVTLSRLRPSMDVHHLLSAHGDFRVPVVVSGVTMFRSRATSNGPRYEAIERMPLR